jgi:Domain of unknown function (DUF222)
MFEAATPDALITEIEASQQQESELMAHRLAAIAALLSQRTAEAEKADPDPGYSMITGFARTTAEVSAAMNMSPMGANHLVAQAEALDTRLPKIAALLAEGKTDWRTVQVIITRTELVSSDLIAQLDQSLEQLSISVDQDLLCGGLLRGRFVGAFDEFAVLELRAGADERDQVRRVDGAPA